jgi:hypothetical protein
MDRRLDSGDGVLVIGVDVAGPVGVANTLSVVAVRQDNAGDAAPTAGVDVACAPPAERVPPSIAQAPNMRQDNKPSSIWVFTMLSLRKMPPPRR